MSIDAAGGHRQAGDQPQLLSCGGRERTRARSDGQDTLRPAVYATRLLLEKAVSRAASLNREQAHVDALKRIVLQSKKLIRLDDMSASRKLSGDFHSTVAEATKISTLIRVYKVAANSFPDWMLYQAMFEHPDELEQSIKEEYQEHLAIAEAIGARDANLAQRRAEEHIREIGAQIVLYLGVPQELLDNKINQLGL